MNWNKLTPTLGILAVALIAWQNIDQGEKLTGERETVMPDWAAIASWPGIQADFLEAQPDPNRRVTMIILDDSGSMGRDLTAAKSAVVSALDAMKPEDRVAVLALNAGTVLPFSTVRDAERSLSKLLRPLESAGTTPLARSVTEAQAMLAQEAAHARGFGTFRLIVTTDGQADDGPALDAAIETLAATTPIQLTTIGISVGRGHVLRRDDLGSFVDVVKVAALADALQAAVAENTDFTAITDFGDAGG
jgi:uncharacterized protein with von Willebrand factor type A (vWA) domain